MSSSPAGVPDVSINELIASAGVAKATFYRHFTSKENVAMAFWTAGRKSGRDGVTDGFVCGDQA